MSTTYESPEQKSRGINVRVTQTFFDAFAAKAAEVPGRTPTEYARYLCERALYEEPDAHTLRAEVWAVRTLVAKGILDPNRPTTELGVKTLIYETDRDKFDKARQMREQRDPMSEAARPAHAGQWMPTRPMGTITAVVSAVVVAIGAAVLLVQFSWSPLQRFYLSAYAKATIGQALGLPAKPYTQILMTGTQDPTRKYFAATGDIEVIEAAGDGWAPELSEAARQDGMTRAFAQVSRVPQDRMHALLARNIYHEQGLFRLAQVPLVTGALALALFLVWGIRVDFRRSRERRRGARLRGTELLSSMATFNNRVAGRS